MPNQNQNTLPTWQEVEQQLQHEMQWLETAIDTYGDRSVDTAGNPVCKQCTLRVIATLLIYGDIEAHEITKDPLLHDFWLVSDEEKIPPVNHGKDWHREKMRCIESHFLQLGCKVEREPNLHVGRADLGVYDTDAVPLYVEVGTTSYYKLAVNMKSMQHFTYLIVPDDERLIEFKKQ